MAEWQTMFGDDASDTDSGDEDFPAKQHSHNKLTLTSFQSPFIVKKIAGIGGMRGVFAARDLPAGTLVLAECPIYTWKGHFSDIAVLRSTVTGICASERAYAATRALHPFVLTDADEEEIATMRELWGDALPLAVSDLRALDHDLPSSAGLDADADELLRVSIALQHNAYGSGFYEMFSLVNHTCAPNCIKLCPVADKGWRKASEIWTNRNVKEGEELTICYNHIREMTDRSVAKFLHEHHRFQCNCPVHPLSCSLPKCSNDVVMTGGDGTVADEEGEGEGEGEEGGDWCTVLQERVEYYEEQLERFSGEHSENKKKRKLEVMMDIIAVCDEMLSEISEQMLFAPDLFATLKNITNGKLSVTNNQLAKPAIHLNPAEPLSVRERDAMYMTVRLHKLAVSAASACVQELGAKEGALLARRKQALAHKAFMKLVWASEQYLKHAVEVAPLQLYYLGDAHPDIAQTFLDIAEGIHCAATLVTAAAAKYPGGEQREEGEVLSAVGETEGETEAVLILKKLHASDPDRFTWAQSDRAAKVMGDRVREEGERVAGLYKPHYDLVQERLVTAALLMPDAY